MKDKLLEIIKKFDSIVVFGHINPDGDCYGSQTALKKIINQNFSEKNVYIVGSGIKRFFCLLGNMDEVTDEIIKDSLAIIVDCSAYDRLEDTRVSLAKAVIIFDHHIPNEDLIDAPSLIDTEKIATCEIITEWAIKNNLAFDQLAAEALFLGICTDSGRFVYKQTTGNTLRLASVLIDKDFDIEQFYEILYLTYEKDLRLQGFILSRYKKTKSGFIYVTFTQKDLKNLHLEGSNVASKVNTLANIEGYKVWGVFTEYPDGIYRVELRSRGISIQPVTLMYGGGGHANACGIARLAPEKIKSVIDSVDKYLLEKQK